MRLAVGQVVQTSYLHGRGPREERLRGKGIVLGFSAAGDVVVHLFGCGPIPYGFSPSDVEVL